VLYRNNCDGTFTPIGDAAGILGRDTVEWGTNFVDFDNDGDEDLSIVAGAMLSSGEPNVLYENVTVAPDELTLVDVTAATGTQDLGEGWGSAWADIDDDGDLDWMVSNLFGQVALFRNDGPTGNHLRVELQGTTSNRDGIGARVEVTAAGRTMVRYIRAGLSYISAEELEAFFGLGDATVVDELVVKWPSGTVDTLAGPIGVNQTLQLVEGSSNLPPNVTINSPADGLVVVEGTLVNFDGTADDVEDGDISASLTWSSNIDGALGVGATFSLSTLSVGTHTITAEVTDSGGLTGSSNVSLTVNESGGTVMVTFTSVGPEDGMIQESSETSGIGQRANSTASAGGALRAGDAQDDSQLVLIVSFDTSSIPDNAVVTAADLRLRRGQLAGTSPFDTHGTCQADVSTGGFGGDPAFAASDFEAAATATAVATLSNPLAHLDWAEGALDANGLAAISLTGTTQFRVYFSVDDDDDATRDYIGFYPGEATDPANQPQLVVTYDVP
jgi:hypothetical protein